MILYQVQSTMYQVKYYQQVVVHRPTFNLFPNFPNPSSTQKTSPGPFQDWLPKYNLHGKCL